MAKEQIHATGLIEEHVMGLGCMSRGDRETIQHPIARTLGMFRVGVGVWGGGEGHRVGGEQK